MGKIDFSTDKSNRDNNHQMTPNKNNKRGRKPQQIVKSTQNPLEKEIKNHDDFDVFISLPFKNDDLEDDNDSDSSEENGIIYFDQPTTNECNTCRQLKEKNFQLEKQNKSLLSKHFLADGYKKADFSKVNVISMNGDEMKIKSKTNMDCFYDNRPFKTQPCILVEDIRQGKYQVRDNFCSPNCALAYNERVLKDGNVQRRRILTNNFYRKVYQIEIGKPFEIRLAPVLSKLISRGGNMTIEQFREDSMIINKEYLEFYPPSTSIVPVILEQSN